MADDDLDRKPSPSPSQTGGAGSARAPEPAATAGSRRLSRRRLIELFGAVGVSAGLGARVFEHVGAAAASGSSLKARRSEKKRPAQWAMIVDLRYCDGCKACTAACQQAHYLPQNIEWIKVYRLTAADGQTYPLPKPCMMCENPPCVPVCPVGATYRTDEGLVLIDQTACIGCRFCMAACPYESRYFNTAPAKKVPPQPFPPSPEWPVPQVQDTVGKCILCAARLPAGVLPACVQDCPMGALYIGDLTTDVAVNSLGNAVKISDFLREHDAVRLKEELGTKPRVYYIPGHGQELLREYGETQ